MRTLFVVALYLFILAAPPAFSASSDLADGKTIIVIGHLDDEALWFLPLMPSAQLVVHAGPPTSYTKAAAFSAAWPGVNIQYVFPPVSDQQHYQDSLNPCARDATYNYTTTLNGLRPILTAAKANGATRVVTHNPWGEYGHPNHRNMSSVTRNLNSQELHLDVWVPAVIRPEWWNQSSSGTLYYEADSLYGVDYSDSYYVNHYIFSSKRNTYASYSSWTWYSGTYDYPHSYRRYWRVVKNMAPNYTVDLLGNPTLQDQVKKIRGDIPYLSYEYPKHVASLYYSCQ
jgi:hypothetical protein